MKKKISLIGSTGSIGTQTLDVIRHIGYEVGALAANKNARSVEKQAREFCPKVVCMYDDAAAKELKTALSDTNIKVLSGMEGLCEAAAFNDADITVTAVSGMIGLKPTLCAIDAGKTIALANKETLVCAGNIVMSKAREKDVNILPVDSEHSALFQCLEAMKDKKTLSKLILTASGGPFFGKTKAELEHVTKAQALKHPNWDMGAKITIDSATLMNKGLEFIEAMWLYDVSPDDIDIIVHRESIIHSMVRFVDNSYLAQIGTPDMRLPIQYALTYPDRCPSLSGEVDFAKLKSFTFFPPDKDVFPCLPIAISAAKTGGNACAVMNAANEEAVALFLKEKLSFYGISDLVGNILSRVEYIKDPTLDDIISSDKEARTVVKSLTGERSCAF